MVRRDIQFCSIHRAIRNTETYELFYRNYKDAYELLLAKRSHNSNKI